MHLESARRGRFIDFIDTFERAGEVGFQRHAHCSTSLVGVAFKRCCASVAPRYRHQDVSPASRHVNAQSVRGPVRHCAGAQVEAQSFVKIRQLNREQPNEEAEHSTPTGPQKHPDTQVEILYTNENPHESVINPFQVT